MRIACWQAACGRPDVPDFLRRLRATARQAADSGAELLVTPEMSLGGYPLRAANLAQAAGPVDGPLCEAVSEIARTCGIAVAHGWPETEGDKVYNSVRLVDAEGRSLTSYRKSHLFGDVDRSVFAPGSDGVVQATLNGLTVGMLICYDVEFPEMVRTHALAGTQLLLVPTALMQPWEFIARTIVPARAFESQLYIAYTNWTGDRHGLRFCGLTTVAAPDGTQTTLGTTEDLLITDVDPATITAARTTTPYLSDRRPDLYRKLTTD